MRLERTLLYGACTVLLAGQLAWADTPKPSDFMQPTQRSAQISGLSIEGATEKDAPAWLRDSQRLEKMLGADGEMRVEDAHVVRKVETPIAGIEGFVVQAKVFSKGNPEGEDRLSVFYTDKSGRYLFVGMLVDTDKNMDLNLVTERFVRGDLADNPAHALRPEDMHSLVLAGGNDGALQPLYFVIDVGPKEGRDNFIIATRLHHQLTQAGRKLRDLHIIPVSAGNGESGTGAMAISLGYESVGKNGTEKLLDYALHGKQTSWLQPRRLNADPELKQMLGLGIFQMEDNSTQAMLARLNILPLVYIGQASGPAKNVALPVDEAGWIALFTS